jgi:tetratricopeptide (TPR) repeat protein
VFSRCALWELPFALCLNLFVATPARETLIPPAKGRALFSSPQKQNLILCLLLAAVTLVLYNPVNHHPFVNYDDDRYVVQNPHIRGISGETIVWAFTTNAEANWHPLTWISHTLDYQLFRLNAGGHHLTSLLLHAANVVLLFLLLKRSTGRSDLSLMVAALFAVHPINVESVAWVAERKNVLCTFFFFLTLGAYGWYARKPDWRRYLAVATLFAMGLMSKPMVITLPFVLLLLDYWPLGRIQGSPAGTQNEVPQRSISKLLIEKLPLLALSVASAWITMKAQQAGGAVRSEQQFPFGVRLENSVVAYGAYLWKMIWPAKLAVLYPHPGNSLPVWQIALGIAVLLGVSAVVLRYRSRRYLATGWLWFLGTLVPVIGIVQVGYQSMADRYAYIPLIGVFVMVVWGAADLADHWKLARVWRVLPAVVLLLALSGAARRQLGYWASGYDLWSHTVAVNPNNFIAHDNLGDALLAQGKRTEAYSQFQMAAAIMPTDPWSHTSMGAYLQEHGRLQEAMVQYRMTIGLSRDQAMLALAYANLGSVFRDMGYENQARESYDHAIELNPGQFNAYFGRGVLLERQGRLAEAISDLSRSAELQPTAQAYVELGRLFAQTGHVPEAFNAYQQALKISPDLVEAQQAAEALRQQKK